MSRHAGHADIVREPIDGEAGLSAGNTNIDAPAEGWEAYRTRLERLALGSTPD